MEAQALPPQGDHRQRNRQIARSTLVVMLAFGAAKAISLLQTFIIARTFGVGRVWDTFVAANRVPELIFTLIAGGALATAFIPIFTGFLAREDQAGAWRVASHVINTIFTTTLVISVLVFVLAPWLVETVVAPGFDTQGVQQTAELMRIMLLSTLIFSVSGIVMGILQSHNHFLLPALAPIMFDLGILFGVVFLLDSFGVHGIAMGAVLGAALHLGIQVPGLIHFRVRWTPRWGFDDPMLWKVIRLMIPRVGGLGVFSLNFIIMNNIASRLGAGAISALDWGWRLMQIPQTLLGTAMGVVIFPTLAALSEQGDESGKRDAMSGALRFILAATIPASVGLVFVGQSLISLLEGGAFDTSASAWVYSTLRAFALGLIVHSALEVVARSFYADKDTLTPFWAALGGAAINLVLSVLLSGVTQVVQPAAYNALTYPLLPVQFEPTYGNVSGLALANSLGVMFEVGLLLAILRQRWHGVKEHVLVGTVLKATAASLVMAVAIVLVNTLWTALGFADRGIIFTIAQVGVETVSGLVVFLLAGMLLQMEELRMLWGLFWRRAKLAEATV